MRAARDFITTCAASNKPVLIVPDKDADGLAAGAILYHTLTDGLGLDPALISVHLVAKGSNIHDPAERAAMAAHDPAYIIVLDQGSREAPPVVDNPAVRSLIIDHHFAPSDSSVPAHSERVSAWDCLPVATSSLLTYLICRPLTPDPLDKCDWLAVVGTQGDLGNAVAWTPPFPNMRATIKKYKKRRIDTAVSLVNAPRRTAGYSVRDAWDALLRAGAPADLEADARLEQARQEVKAETARCARVPPRFSADGRVAVLRLHSTAQIHPIIAARWAGFLTGAHLEVVMVANEGYMPGRVHFSCRVPKAVRGRGVDIIEVLEGIAARSQDEGFRARLGQSFARGHKEASGGVVGLDEFAELLRLMGVTAGSGGPANNSGGKKLGPEDLHVDGGNRNGIMNYFSVQGQF